MIIYRSDKDSMDEINIPENRLWGAQTQRSLEQFHLFMLQACCG